MDLLRYVVLFILLKYIHGASYYISEHVTNWTSASRNCKLATPDLLSLPMKISVLQDADIDVIWVGYYEAKTALEYFGCTEKDNNVLKFITKADPGQCMSICGTKNIIGIYGKECFCLDIDAVNDNYQNTMAPVCNKSCDKLNGTACGGPATSTDDGVNTKSYMSLYRSIGTDNTTGAEGSESICKYYDHQGFHWQACNQSLDFICEKGSSVWIQTGNQGARTYKSWLEATQLCFTNNTRPSTYNNTMKLRRPFGTAPLWTGIVRSYVYYKYSIDPSHIQHAQKFGVLKRTENGYVLKFRNKKGKRESLCVNETSIDDISSSSTTTSSTPESEMTTVSFTTDTETTATEIETPVLTTATTRSSSETDSSIQLQNTSDSSSIGTITGATTAVVVVIVVVILLLVFLRKRGVQLPFLKKKEGPTHNPSISRNNMGYAITELAEVEHSNTNQSEYADIDLNTVTGNEGEHSVVNNETDKSDYEHDYFTLEKQEEGQYESTKAELQTFDQNTFNPYNKLSVDDESDYDHLGNGKMNGGISERKASGFDDTYNTTSLGNSNLETSNGESFNDYNMMYDSEDTYNHTNLSTSKNGPSVSENDYDAI